MINLEPKTIAEQIDCLARLTNAPSSFVGQVRELFSRKGISLDDDATPYLKALEEAFRREEVIRTNARRAERERKKVNASVQRIGNEYAKQIRRLKQTRRSLRKAAEGARSNSVQVAIPGNHRTFVTPPQREDIPMVPGPDDLQ